MKNITVVCMMFIAISMLCVAQSQPIERIHPMSFSVVAENAAPEPGPEMGCDHDATCCYWQAVSQALAGMGNPDTLWFRCMGLDAGLLLGGLRSGAPEQVAIPRYTDPASTPATLTRFVRVE